MPVAKRRAPILITVLRSFRDDERPRVRQWRTTMLSTKWRHRQSICCRCSARQRSVVKVARASNTLICSDAPVHFHPEMIRQRHSLPGMLALMRWYLMGSSVACCRSISSPFNDEMPTSFCINSLLNGRVLVAGVSGGLLSKVHKLLLYPGVKRCTSSSSDTL